MKTLITSVALCFGIVWGSFAQNQVDALRYSLFDYNSNPRANGLGNAIGALGANTLSPLVNPGGIGLYRQSEVSTSIGLSNTSINSDYLGSSVERDNYNAHMGNLNLVLSKVRYKMGEPRQDDWVGYTFAAGFNRTNNFNRRTVIQGNNTSSSILNFFVDQANGRVPGELGVNTPAGLAYDAFLINPFSDDSTNYFPVFFDSGGINMQQTQNITESGSQNDIYFSFGGNYENKFYIGATVAFPQISYEYSKTFDEVNQDEEEVRFYQSSQFREDLDASGNGVNAGIGIIYRPFDFFRFGASIFSPTYYRIQETFSYGISSSLLNPAESYDYSSAVGEYSYTLITPFRANLSSVFTIGKIGLISVDYELIDPSTATLNADDYGFIVENSNINNIYQASNNLRIGTEWRYNKFYARAGYSFLSRPVRSDFTANNYGNGRSSISGGLGYRDENFYIDLSIVRTETGRTYTPYASSLGSPVALLDEVQTGFMIGGGFNF